MGDSESEHWYPSLTVACRYILVLHFSAYPGVLGTTADGPEIWKKQLIWKTISVFIGVLCNIPGGTWAMTKKTSCLGYIGDDNLPIYVWIIVNHYKDPY